MATRQKKKPVRMAKKSTPAKSAQAEKPQAEAEPQSEPEATAAPESSDVPDNVVDLDGRRVAQPGDVIEDPAVVFKLCMLESDMEKMQLKQQVVASQANVQISEIIKRRDNDLAGLKIAFDRVKARHTQLREQVEEKYGIPRGAYTYDDELGTIKVNQKAGPLG